MHFLRSLLVLLALLMAPIAIRAIHDSGNTANAVETLTETINNPSGFSTLIIATTVTPIYTRTITVSAIHAVSALSAINTSGSTSTSASLSISGPAFVRPTAAQQACIQPGGGAIICFPTDYNEATPSPRPTMIIGTVAAPIQKSAAIPLGASNMFKPIAASLKAISSIGVGAGRKLVARWWVCADFIVCDHVPGQPNYQSDTASSAISLGPNYIFKLIVDGVKMIHSFGLNTGKGKITTMLPFKFRQEWVVAHFKAPNLRSPGIVPPSPSPTGLPVQNTELPLQNSVTD